MPDLPAPATALSHIGGPWRAELPGDSAPYIRDRRGWVILLVAPHVPVSRRARIACAAAATPTLLAACQDVRAELEAMTPGGPFFGPLAACLHSLDAALAAATRAR